MDFDDHWDFEEEYQDENYGQEDSIVNENIAIFVWITLYRSFTESYLTLCLGRHPLGIDVTDHISNNYLGWNLLRIHNHDSEL